MWSRLDSPASLPGLGLGFDLGDVAADVGDRDRELQALALLDRPHAVEAVRLKSRPPANRSCFGSLSFIFFSHMSLRTVSRPRSSRSSTPDCCLIGGSRLMPSRARGPVSIGSASSTMPNRARLAGLRLHVVDPAGDRGRQRHVEEAEHVRGRVAVTSPTWLAAGQDLVAPAWNSAVVHSGVAVGLPIRPGGRWMVRSRTLSSGPDPVNGISIVKSLLAPAWASAGSADRPGAKPMAACAPGAATRDQSASARDAIHAFRAEPPTSSVAIRDYRAPPRSPETYHAPWLTGQSRRAGL
jgi:hypothetical protein